MRAFVRFSLFNGHSVLGIRDGIDGLLQNKVLSKLLSNDQRECGRVTFSKVKTLLLDFLKVLIFLFLVDFCHFKGLIIPVRREIHRWKIPPVTS